MATTNTTTLGTKFICFMCQCKFYDLNRPDAICPRCNANQKDQPKQPKSTSSRSRASERVREEVYVAPSEEEEEVAPTDTEPTETDLLDKAEEDTEDEA
jgi:uncharacterized protein (TIGR02300 family)